MGICSLDEDSNDMEYIIIRYSTVGYYDNTLFYSVLN